MFPPRRFACCGDKVSDLVAKPLCAQGCEPNPKKIWLVGCNSWLHAFGIVLEVKKCPKNIGNPEAWEIS